MRPAIATARSKSIMKLAIAIPARYGSTRFPGKPLALINGKTMLQRVVELAHKAAEGCENVDIFVTTEDSRIRDHAQEIFLRDRVHARCARACKNSFWASICAHARRTHAI